MNNFKKDKKTRSITIRVTDKEYEKICAGAEVFDMNITQYINHLVQFHYMHIQRSKRSKED